MLPNQRNIELMIVDPGAASTRIKLINDSLGTDYTDVATDGPKAPVRLVRGVPGDVDYLSSDVIIWNEKLLSVERAAYAVATEDKWTLANINTVVDGSNPARELNLRVWPLGLSSIEFQRLKNTGHFKQLDATQSAVLVASEFAQILDANYQKNRYNGSMGLHAYVVTGAGSAITGTTPTATFKEGVKSVAIEAAAADLDVAEFEPGGAIVDVENGITYLIASAVQGATAASVTVTLQQPAVKSSGTPTAPTIFDKATIDNTSTIAPASIVLEATANKFDVGQYNWEKTRLNVTTYGMGPVTYTTMAHEGIGMGEQVAEREWFLKGNEGRPFRTAGGIAPYNPSTLVTNLTETYDMLYWRFSHDMLEALGQPNNSPKLISLALANSTHAIALKTKIDGYISQS